jgi:ubiquinone/menaquinone biosynthesis C-methylase UbiE
LPVKDRTVLEIGCGPGGNLVHLAQAQPARLVGCDISSGMVELARQHTQDLPHVEIMHVDGTTLPFADRSFDLTYTVTVLQHNHDEMLAQLLHEICRVTGKQLYLFEDTARVKRAGFSCVLRPVSEYATLCAAHGFERVSSEPIGLFMSYGVSRVLRALLSRGRQEGMPPSRLHMWLEKALLPVTSKLDRIVPRRRGLTGMVFRRTS